VKKGFDAFIMAGWPIFVYPGFAAFQVAHAGCRLHPNNPGGDAFHLAIASFHRCDFLVTWNCQHIANANKFGHIRRVNGILGLGNPALVTPLELLNEELDHG
jgi:hypothetical protein